VQSTTRTPVSGPDTAAIRVGWRYAPPVTRSVWPLTKSLSGLQNR